jgi:hypothetical protein
MTGDFAHLVRCLDVREKDLADAIVSRERTRGLVLHMAACSAPNTGVAKVLLVFARMATTACAWIDGDLLVELVGDEELSVVEGLTELGGGLRERLFAPASFCAPLSEFARAIERVPHLITPLALRNATARRISLSASALVRRTTFPPPPVEIAADSLFVRAPVAAAAPRADAAIAALPVVEPLINEIDRGWED